MLAITALWWDAGVGDLIGSLTGLDALVGVSLLPFIWHESYTLLLLFGYMYDSDDVLIKRVVLAAISIEWSSSRHSALLRPLGWKESLCYTDANMAGKVGSQVSESLALYMRDRIATL